MVIAGNRTMIALIDIGDDFDASGRQGHQLFTAQSCLLDTHLVHGLASRLLLNSHLHAAGFHQQTSL